MRSLDQVIKLNITNNHKRKNYVPLLQFTGKYTTIPKRFNLNLIMRKESDKSKLRDILQSN